jgi:hypothetical protein
MKILYHATIKARFCWHSKRFSFIRTNSACHHGWGHWQGNLGDFLICLNQININKKATNTRPRSTTASHYRREKPIFSLSINIRSMDESKKKTIISSTRMGHTRKSSKSVNPSPMVQSSSDARHSRSGRLLRLSSRRWPWRRISATTSLDALHQQASGHDGAAGASCSRRRSPPEASGHDGAAAAVRTH